MLKFPSTILVNAWDVALNSCAGWVEPLFQMPPLGREYGPEMTLFLVDKFIFCENILLF
jgi:hypothetical protein